MNTVKLYREKELKALGESQREVARINGVLVVLGLPDRDAPVSVARWQNAMQRMGFHHPAIIALIEHGLDWCGPECRHCASRADGSDLARETDS